MCAGADFRFDPAVFTVAICGLPLIADAVEKLAYKRKISSSFLISLAMAASLYIGEVFAAGEIAFIMALGEILEERTVERAKRGIRSLMSIIPARGRVLRGGVGEDIEISKISPGDIVRVLPGESVPVDGEIISGNTSIDQSVVTGESIPVDKSPGDGVFCGTINRFGTIDVRVANAGKDSSLEKLVRLVREAEEKKSPTERIADKWASRLVPAAILVALVTFFATGDISRAVTVLVVFCPCALVLATPTTVMAAIGQAAKYGVIVKSGEALEKMGKVDCIAFDKTGTLTRGAPSVSDVAALTPRHTQNDILSLAASVESLSEHPLGRAISEFAKYSGIKPGPAKNFAMVPGRGVRADVGGKAVACGNLDWLVENGFRSVEGFKNLSEKFSGEGKASVFVGIGGEAAGIIALSDMPRRETSEVFEELRQMRVKSALLTGDTHAAASFFAKKTGISEVFSGLLPSQKAERIAALRSEGFVVCMVGDGVNDAPALKSADVGVAMGTMGSDIAVDAADIALMGDDLTKIPYLKRLSSAAVELIRFNIILSMCINFAAILLSIGAVLTPVSGALVHNLASVLVVLNAGLLYDRNYLKGGAGVRGR